MTALEKFLDVLGLWILEKFKILRNQKQAPWSGYWFVNVGEGTHRNWNDNVKYGYIGAGQGPWYSESLKKLSPGDEIFRVYEKTWICWLW